MKLLKNIIILSNLVIIFIFAGCGSTGSLKTMNIYSPDWEGSNIGLLPFSDKPEQIAKIVMELSRRNAPEGQKLYAMRLAQHGYNLDKKNKNSALVLAHASFLVADSEENKKKKMAAAEIGKDAAESAGFKEKDPVACYYYALNLGIIVNIKGLFAIGKLPDILNALKIAVTRPEIDEGGPLRTIGILYLKAPSWPKGVGDLDSALDNLKRVAEEFPLHPQNYIFYSEALLEDDEKDEALKYLELADRLTVPEIWGKYYSDKWMKEIKRLKGKASK